VFGPDDLTGDGLAYPMAFACPKLSSVVPSEEEFFSLNFLTITIYKIE
jgi:hypothetical protein